MYLFLLTLKTPHSIFAITILLYSIVIAIVCPKLKKSGKRLAAVILCLLPVLAALVHFAIYGTSALFKFFYLYVLALVPLINLLPGKKKVPVAIKSVLSSLLAIVLCLTFIFDILGNPIIHNYTRMSYTQSFKKMLATMEKEYCLSSWKKIDYDGLLKEYLPRVEEAEKNNDESAYATVITEVTYRFFDSHVFASLGEDTSEAVMNNLTGNDYGLSMIKLEDGKVIAVLVESEKSIIYDEPHDITKLGIHDGTQIVAWDGKEINEAIAGTECINPTFQFPVKSNEDFFRPVFLAGKGGETVDVTFIDDNGSEQHAELKKLGGYSGRLSGMLIKLLHLHDYTPNFSTKMIDDKCGYLIVRSEYYSSFYDNLSVIRSGYYPELVEFYANKIEELKAQGMEYLVIDIRNNGGGYDNVAGALASLFTTEKKYMCGFGYEDEKGYHTTESEYIFPDGRYKDLPVVVLTNAVCGSAGDGMAKFLGECDNVTLMGITSSSGVNQNNGGVMYLTKNITVYYPIALTLSSEGVPLIDTDNTRENNIPLEEKIPITREFALKTCDFNSEADPQLEYAVRYLAAMKKAKGAN